MTTADNFLLFWSLELYNKRKRSDNDGIVRKWSFTKDTNYSFSFWTISSLAPSFSLSIVISQIVCGFLTISSSLFSMLICVIHRWKRIQKWGLETNTECLLYSLPSCNIFAALLQNNKPSGGSRSRSIHTICTTFLSKGLKIDETLLPKLAQNPECQRHLLKK